MSAEPQTPPAIEDPVPEKTPTVRSLRALIDQVSGRGLTLPRGDGDAGIADITPFPFLGIVGQAEMKLALVIALVNPAVGGVLLVGPRGTGKTTAVRSLVSLLPESPRSLCYYGCTEEDIQTGGMDAVCPDCARKFGQGEPLTRMDRVRLVELPLNARIEDVVGGADERLAIQERLRIRRGLLAQADRNLLYTDEVNLLAEDIVDAILDAAAQGSYTVRRGPVAATYRSRFVLVGSMNPEEGRLRPQIMDRFGLRVIVKGLADRTERLEAYRRVQAYLHHPRLVLAEYAAATSQLQADIQHARQLLSEVTLSPQAITCGLALVAALQIDSLRAEITLFEAARAHAAADDRTTAALGDLAAVAPMALRLRRSQFIETYLTEQDREATEIEDHLERVQEGEHGIG